MSVSPLAGQLPEPSSLIDVDRNDLCRLRKLVYDLFVSDNPRLRDDSKLRECVLFAPDQIEMLVPLEIPQFVDFYAGIHHASNVGKMFRPDMAPLLPNYRSLPVGYNGRASTVVTTETPIRRPKGMFKPADSDGPIFEPTRELDFELEMGFFIGEGNEAGEMIEVSRAAEHILGLVLVNDWSARDVQRWEYQPLGPFLAKSFATSISPWIVSLDALDAFRIPSPEQEPPPLPHLAGNGMHHYDITLEVSLQTARMSKPQLISRSNSKNLYWSFAQMLAHQTSNGTKIEPGDLYASGTISGDSDEALGSMLELTWKGTRPVVLKETGEERRFIEDGDTVIMTGYCQGSGYRVGFGEVRNTIG